MIYLKHCFFFLVLLELSKFFIFFSFRGSNFYICLQIFKLNLRIENGQKIKINTERCRHMGHGVFNLSSFWYRFQDHNWWNRKQMKNRHADIHEYKINKNSVLFFGTFDNANLFQFLRTHVYVIAFNDLHLNIHALSEGKKSGKISCEWKKYYKNFLLLLLFF